MAFKVLFLFNTEIFQRRLTLFEIFQKFQKEVKSTAHLECHETSENTDICWTEELRTGCFSIRQKVIN